MKIIQESTETHTRLLIIDDHPLVREALESRLNITSEMEVIGCTGSWQAGLEAVDQLHPDVVLLETKRCDQQGLEALHYLTEKCPFVNVIILTSYPDIDEQTEALQIGAVDYKLKDINTPQLVEDIKMVMVRHSPIVQDPEPADLGATGKP